MLMHKGPTVKALDHEGGFANVMGSASKTSQVWLLCLIFFTFFEPCFGSAKYSFCDHI